MEKQIVQIVYVPIEIKSQEDLPKESDTYFVHLRGCEELGIDIYTWYSQEDNNHWLNTFDWYLQPVEMPAYEKLKAYADNYSLHAGKSRMAAYQGFLAGFDWLKNKLTNK